MDIKITDTSRARNIWRASKKKTEPSGTFKDTINHSDESYPIKATTLLSAIDPLFLELENPSSNQAAIDSGLKLLDYLDELRIVLLGSNDARNNIIILNRIHEEVSKISQHTVDVELEKILKEIETRAVVEIAKINF